MLKLENSVVSHLDLLVILIELKQWQDSQLQELQSVSGQALYFKIAASLLEDSEVNLTPLKRLNDRMTDRAIRNRVREFQKLGLVEVIDIKGDGRTKGLIITKVFLEHLNMHLKLFKQLCDTRYVMVRKSKENPRSTKVTSS